MAIETSYNELLKSFNYAPRNYYVTRNVPLDIRFLIDNLDNLNNRIPTDIRYPGLIFFVRDANITDGTTNNLDGTKKLGSLVGTTKIHGTLYYFDDKLQPVPLHDAVTRFEIRLLDFGSATSDTVYKLLVDTTANSNETNSLNHIFAKIGNIVYIEPLGIAAICRYKNNQIVWEYFAGSYHVKTEAQFNNIPASLKKPNVTVNVNGTDKIIGSDLKLSDEIITKSSTKDCTENKRFYNINGFIYYRFGGLTIPVSNKFVVKTLDLKVTDNTAAATDTVKRNIIDLTIDADNDTATIFDSNFNTRNIVVDCIKNSEGESQIDALYANKRFPIEHRIIDNNKLEIISSIAIKNVSLLIYANS